MWTIPMLLGLATALSLPAGGARAESLLSDQQRSECAGRFADMLRAWKTVVASENGVDLAAPILMVRRDLTRHDVHLDADALLRAMQLRMGSKVRFIRRDEKDPTFLSWSDRFDYETRIRVTTGRESSDNPLRLVLEAYMPAAESPAFSMDYPFSPRRQINAELPRATNRTVGKDSVDAKRADAKRAEPPHVQASELSRQRDATEGPKKQAAVREISGKTSEKTPADLNSKDGFGRGAKRSVTLEVGYVYFMDKKTASRVVVTSAQDRPLEDGRLEVRITFVSKKDDQDVEVRAAFYDQADRRVEKGKKRDYELEQGRPRTILIRSTRPAVRFRLTVEDD